MKDILDYEKSQKTRTLFSKLSFCLSVLSLILFFGLLASIPEKITASEGIKPPPLPLVYSLFASCLIGLTCTVLSFWQKEKSRFFKIAGAILNILVFIFIVGSIVFARMV